MMDNKNSKKTNNPQVVIAGRNYCNILTMARSLGEAGYDVEILRFYKKRPARHQILQKMKPEAYSKYTKAFREYVVNDDVEMAVTELETFACSREKKMIFPVDDFSAGIIDAYYDRLKTKFIIPNIDHKSGELARLMDKWEQKSLAEGFDLPLLNSVLIKSQNGTFEIPDGIEYPCFIKPNISMHGAKAIMSKCNSENELEKLLAGYAKKEDFEILVEDFADIEAEYSLLGFATGDSVEAPALFKALAGGHRERKGVAVTGEIIPTTAFQDVIDKCCSFISSLNYTGIFDIDLIQTTDGKLYFIEINFRPGASIYAFVKAGVNLPGAFTDRFFAEVESERELAIEKKGLQFVSEKVLLEEYVRGDISFRDARRYIREADIHFMKDKNDPKPYRYFRRRCMFAFFMRILYKAMY